MRRFPSIRLKALLMLLVFSPGTLFAGVRKIQVQGKLTNAAGVPLAGSPSVEFKLYTTPTGGAAAWSSGVSTVTLAAGGLFNVALQDGAPTSLDAVVFDKPYYLGIRVGADAEMTPRQELGAAALSYGSPNDFVAAGRITASRITVRQSGAAGDAIVIDNDTTGTRLHLEASSGEAEVRSENSDLRLHAGDTANIIFKFTGIERARFDNIGRLGIGTAVPGAKLDVAGDIRATGVYYSSDKRLKKNVRALPTDTLNKVTKLNGVAFDWDVAEFKRAVQKRNLNAAAGEPEVSVSTAPQIGLIAQEVEAQFPALVFTDADGFKSVDYGKMSAVLLEALKAQQKMIADLRLEVDQLKQKVK